LAVCAEAQDAARGPAQRRIRNPARPPHKSTECWIDKTITLNVDMGKNDPNIDEVNARVESGGLRGPVDWVFPAWEVYIEYEARRIAEAFPLTEEERRALLGFGEVMKGLLQRAHEYTRTKLTSIYDAINNNNYKLEGGRLYAPDGAWMHVGEEPHVVIEDIEDIVYFPDVMKLPHEKLELFQLGWEVHEEEGEGGRPVYATADPALFLAWAAARFGELHVSIARALLLEDGVAVEVKAVARSWKKRWSRREAERLVEKYAKRGVWEPFFTMWLGE